MSVDEGSTFLIWAALGEGCLAVGVGKMMSWFSYNWLIFGMACFNLAILVANRVNHHIMSRNQSIRQPTSAKA